MADPAGTHSDGTVQWGTQIVQIPASTGTNFIANSIRITQATEKIDSKNVNGVVARQVLIEQPFTGSAVLQLADNTVNVPNIGSTFLLQPKANGANVNCKVTQWEIAEEQAGETLYTVEFSKQLN